MSIRSALIVAGGALLATHAHASSPAAAAVLLSARHHEDGHEHSHGGADFGDDYEFEETSLVWPACVEDCLRDNLESLEPVDHPLCADRGYYDNVTACVVEGCDAYGQGAFAVIAEIECYEYDDEDEDDDDDDDDDADFSLQAVSDKIVDEGGDPQECRSADGEIRCDNGTASGDEDAAVSSVSLGSQVLILGVMLMAVPFAVFL